MESVCCETSLNTSLAYTIDDHELVMGWLQGKTPNNYGSNNNNNNNNNSNNNSYNNNNNNNNNSYNNNSSNHIRDNINGHAHSSQANGGPTEKSKWRVSSLSSILPRKMTYGGDENADRGNWTGKLDFVLSMLGYAVGLGNVWRFPYLCYRNGGGAFLLPYLIMLFLVGLPLFYLEVCLGQFCSRGPAKCWDFAPIFKGVGVSMIAASAIVSIYYNMIIAYAQFFFFASFTSELPWADCDNPEWNTPSCSLKWPLTDCDDGVKETNGTCYTDNAFTGVWNVTAFTRGTGIKRISPSEEYWINNVLGEDESDGPFDLGKPRWHLALSLFLAWIVTFLCLLKGIKTTGKVVYFTALFPYVVLIILFFRGVTLEAAGDGISFYIVPDFSKLSDAKVWRDAANQIFYSLGPAWGGLITLASYNRFNNNSLRDSLIVGIGNSATSLFGGFVVFSYLGYMAKQLNEDVENVVASGAGLAFIVYPEAVTSLPAPPFWSIIFFFMLILLGLDSQFCTVETVLTGILDQYPGHRHRKTWVILFLCIVFFLLGLPLTTNGGGYLLNLMDAYAASWSLMIVGLVESVAISWVYGCNRFFQDIKLMSGRNPSLWWKICWMVVSPSIILFILVFAMVDYSPAEYGDYVYPPRAEALGWFIALGSLVWMPLFAFYKVLKEDEGKSLLQKIRFQSMPNKYWGPALVEHRKMVDYVDDFVLDPEGEKDQLKYVKPTGLAYENLGFSVSDTISVRTRDFSITTPSLHGGGVYPSTISLETTV